MDDLNFTVAHHVGSFERGGAKDFVARNVQESFKKFGFDVDLATIRKEFDKNVDVFEMRKNLINLTNNKGN